MTSITANPSVALDMYETAIASYLVPEMEVTDTGRIELMFDNGFRNVIAVDGLRVATDGSLVGGTVTGIVEYRDDVLMFTADGLAVAVADLITWINENWYTGIFEEILRDATMLTGSELDDRLFSFGGDDTIHAGAGDDEINAGAGADTLDGGAGRDVLDGGDGADRLRGGTDDDYLIGGNGIDTAIFASFFRGSALLVDAGSTTVTGPDGTDVATGVEYFQFADGTFVTDSDSSGAQIMRLYDTVLDRAPDAVGLEFYVGRIEERGLSLAAIAGELAGSAEFQAATGGLTNAQFVDYVYQQALGRAPDAGGKAFYTQLLDQGSSRGAFVVDLSESAEHRGLTATMVANGYFDTDSSYQSVALLYDSFLGRRPDAGGLGFYAGHVKSGTLSLSQVAADFAGSTEFRTATQGKSNAELVDYVYRNTLDRAPDAVGAAYYTDALNQGFGLADFVTEVGLSQEHYNMMSGAIIGGIGLL